jgi:transcriptional regulator GlxA family with amidase domain
MQTAEPMGYGRLVPKASDIEFLYISSSLEPARTSPTVRIIPTHTYETAPRDLDILLIGGPLPSHRPAGSLEFFREAFDKTKVIFTVCTGSLWLASAGVLKGRKATTNRLFLPFARATHPDVEWLDQRWTVDEDGPGAKLWIAGAAGHGK